MFILLAANEEFSGRASMSTVTHGAFAEMPWPFAYAEMSGYEFLFNFKDHSCLVFASFPFFPIKTKILKLTTILNKYRIMAMTPNRSLKKKQRNIKLNKIASIIRNIKPDCFALAIVVLKLFHFITSCVRGGMVLAVPCTHSLYFSI